MNMNILKPISKIFTDYGGAKLGRFFLRSKKKMD